MVSGASRAPSKPRSDTLSAAAMGSLKGSEWPAISDEACMAPGVMAFQETDTSITTKGDILFGTSGMRGVCAAVRLDAPTDWLVVAQPLDTTRRA